MAFTCPKCGMTSHHPEDEKHGYCGNCHEFVKNLPQDKPTGITFWVSGIVAARNGLPYVQLSNDKGMIGQFTVAEARSIAQDLQVAARNAEADAMIMKFFKKMDFPDGAYAALLVEFRDFRHELEMEKVEKSQSDPDTGEVIE